MSSKHCGRWLYNRAPLATASNREYRVTARYGQGEICRSSERRRKLAIHLLELDPWLERAKSSLVASFSNGVIKDRVAVYLPGSSGQTEGRITKLKFVKRRMYGRGKLDLLQARVIGAA